MRRTLWQGLWLIALGALTLVLPAPARAAASSLTIAFTADTDGEIEPCGCPGSPIGGFARRATLLEQMRRGASPVVLLDTGNVLARDARVLKPGTRGDVRHAELMASLVARTGVQGIAVGARDLWTMGVVGVKRLAEQKKLPWLSANVTDARGALLFQPSVVLRAGSLQVGVIGLTDPQELLLGSGIAFRDALVAVREQVRRLEAKVDLVVVLSNLSVEGNDALREGVRGIDLILTGAPPDGGVPLVTGARAPFVVRVAGEGRAVGRIDLRLTPGARSALVRSQPLERRLADLEATRRSLEALRAQIIQEEGRFNTRRFETEGALLRERLEMLSREEAPEGPPRMFAFREAPLGASLVDDPWMAARIAAYKSSAVRDR